MVVVRFSVLNEDIFGSINDLSIDNPQIKQADAVTNITTVVLSHKYDSWYVWDNITKIAKQTKIRLRTKVSQVLPLYRLENIPKHPHSVIPLNNNP